MNILDGVFLILAIIIMLVCFLFALGYIGFWILWIHYSKDEFERMKENEE